MAIGGYKVSFEEDLSAALSADRRTADVPVKVNGKTYTIHYTALLGTEWAEETDKHPVRLNAAIDRHYGYNIRSLVLSLTKDRGRLSFEGETVEVSPEQWDLLFKALDGRGIGDLADALIRMHERPIEETIAALKKASGVVSKKKSR